MIFPDRLSDNSDPLAIRCNCSSGIADRSGAGRAAEGDPPPAIACRSESDIDERSATVRSRNLSEISVAVRVQCRRGLRASRYQCIQRGRGENGCESEIGLGYFRSAPNTSSKLNRVRREPISEALTLPS